MKFKLNGKEVTNPIAKLAMLLFAIPVVIMMAIIALAVIAFVLLIFILLLPFIAMGAVGYYAYGRERP